MNAQRKKHGHTGQSPHGEVADRLGITTRDVKKLPAGPDDILREDTNGIPKAIEMPL